jgi:hypothetical protein
MWHLKQNKFKHMKQHIFTLLLILISTFIFCQEKYLPVRPYEPIKFTYIQPVWYDTIIDTTENNEEGNGYNLLNFTLRCKPEIKDNYLYTSYQTSYKGDVSGTYLEKRDISTEVARSIIFEQDSVRLLSWRSKDTLGIWPPFSIAGIGVTMTERSFSDASGQLGTYLTTMPGDTTAKKFTANPIFVNKVEYILKDPNNDGYRCIYHEVFTNPQYILSVPLDRYGRQNDQTDTIICDRLKTFFVNAINGGKVLLNKRDGEKMFMVIYSDASLNHKEDFWELESFDVEGPTLLLAIDGDNTIWSHSPNSDNEVISVYHRDKLVSKVAMSVEYHYNSQQFRVKPG